MAPLPLPRDILLCARPVEFAVSVMLPLLLPRCRLVEALMYETAVADIE